MVCSADQANGGLHLNTVLLLADDVTVYYILDCDPPLMDSFAILQRHFNVQPVLPDQPLYRVLSRAE
jgi:hypothetical protein